MAAIAVDFDGVIHSYERGWADGSIYGRLIPGAVSGLLRLMADYAVFVHTTRDAHAVAGWLVAESGIPTAREVVEQGRRGLVHYERSADEAGRPMVWAEYAPGSVPLEDSVPLRFWNERGRLLVTERKLPALAYVDDRGVRFTAWDQTLTVLTELDILKGR